MSQSDLGRDSLENLRERAANRKVERTTPEGMPIYYANNIDVRGSFFDFVLTLGFSDVITLEALHIHEIAKVALSPQHAKAFALVLSAHIIEYEKLFGPIVVPEGMLPPNVPTSLD